MVAQHVTLVGVGLSLFYESKGFSYSDNGLEMKISRGRREGVGAGCARGRVDIDLDVHSAFGRCEA